MTLTEFIDLVVETAMSSPICDIPLVRRLSATAVNLRVELTVGGFVDAFYNEQTGLTAYTWIKQRRRIYGADNTGGDWHQHPFADPKRHEPLSGALSFTDFMIEISRWISD